jgi:hypothetical protein
MADVKRAYCPKCEREGRARCTRFHMVISVTGGTTYIKCERSECGWTSKLAQNVEQVGS